MIQVTNLTYRYPGTQVPALKDVNLTVEAGETLGVIGSNLSGKSTLCYAMMGVIPHFHRGKYSGHVVLDEVQVRSSTLGEMAQHAALVFQNPLNQFSGAKLTVEEEIVFGLENLGFEPAEMHRRMEWVTELLGLRQLLSRNPYQLSGGQMQRVAIASVLALRPNVLILDEPTSQLDPLGTDEVFQAIRTLQREGMTSVIVEHNTELLAQHCDRLCVLHGGEVVAVGTPSQVFAAVAGASAQRDPLEKSASASDGPEHQPYNRRESLLGPAEKLVPDYSWGVEIPRYTQAYLRIAENAGDLSAGPDTSGSDVSGSETANIPQHVRGIPSVVGESDDDNIPVTLRQTVERLSLYARHSR